MGMKNANTSEPGQGFILNSETGYFQNKGVDVMAFSDFYPEGHQSSVAVIMHGNRVATNGDVKFEQTPGQWQPVPKLDKRELDNENNTVIATLSYPDRSRHLRGFNPMIYPDFEFSYTVTTKGDGPSIVVTVDLEKPVPEKYLGKMCFNMELFPGDLFGKPWIMDGKQGIFPEQPNGPVVPIKTNYPHMGDYGSDGITNVSSLTGDNKKGYNPYIADDLIGEPYAVGKRFTVRPDDPYSRFTIESKGAELKLYDGRLNHNNGWFTVCCEIPAGTTANAIKWVITPNVVDEWIYPPVIQTSQVGYHTKQRKAAVIELEKRDARREKAVLYKVTEHGPEEIFSADCAEWGRFLRYDYLIFDFTHIEDEGLYMIRYGASESSVFRVAEDIYDRGVWQPVLEYFLPVQMCHMRVNDKYRVWHDLCHEDDARMAPVSFNFIDGYTQGPSTLTKYKPGDSVPGLNVGGWHDAGDDDLRIGSQAGEIYILSMAYEAFNVYYDATSIDQQTKITEIHQPDGKNDLLQQIEHGLLSVVGAYRSLGRLYRGIINSSARQYVLLGDTSAMTDNIPGNDDDRLVFTEDNPAAELTAAAQLAAASRVMKGFNDTLGAQSLEAALELWKVTDIDKLEDKAFTRAKIAKIHCAAELYLTVKAQEYKDYLLSEIDFIVAEIEDTGWFIGRADKALGDAGFSKAIRDALPGLREQYALQSAETPYGIPYRPYIWGAGWIIQRLGYQYYFLHKAYPEIFDPELIFNALNFILGCHPGSNTASFASGVGAVSTTVAYGLNRGDWYYIPGGVVSGTALIRPDFPELKIWPFFWQQVEYVMGGGSSNYMFLVLAAQQILNR